MGDLALVSRNRTAETVTGGLSFPQKMDVPAWGISATRCHVGAVLAQQENTVCSGCYARKGTFRAPAVEKKLEAAYEGMSHPLWVPAMVFMIRYHADERFRWFHSGDLAGINHLRNIIRVCLETPDVCHWLPTREYAIVRACEHEIPENLTVRLSGHMVDGPPPADWPYTSTVVNRVKKATCPSSKHGGNCGTHNCTACWIREGNVSYLRH